MGDSAVPFHYGFHYIHRGCTDITINYTECDKKHSHTEFMFGTGLICLHTIPPEQK